MSLLITSNNSNNPNDVPTSSPSAAAATTNSLVMPKVVVDKKSPAYILNTLFAGGIAGLAAKTAIAPMDRVKIMFQASNPSMMKYAGTYQGVFLAMREIYHTNGIRSLFQGHVATVLRIFPYAAIKFMAYEQFKSRVFEPGPYLSKSASNFLSGSAAGVVSVCCTYPMDMLRTRLANLSERASILQTTRKILQEPNGNGWTSFKILNLYRGFGPTILGMIPYAGISFWSHGHLVDFFKSNLAHISLEQGSSNKLRAWAELTCGGIAGVSAQTASYPFEVLRRRMQMMNTHSSFTLFETARHIWLTRGFKGFFIGLSIGYLKVTPMFAISFYTYEMMKRVLNIA